MTPSNPSRYTDEPVAVGTVLLRAARAVQDAVREALAVHSLTSAQFTVMQLIRELPVPTTQTALTAAAGVSQPTMAATLFRMARDGLIRRTADPDDARQALIRATPASNRVYKKASIAKAVAEAGVLVALNRHEVAELNRYLHTMLGPPGV